VIQINQKDEPAKPALESLPDGLSDDNPALRLCIGQHLGEVRRSREIAQAKVARETGFSRPHLSNVEAGRARTGWRGLQTMADYYQLGMQQLIADCSAMLDITTGAASMKKEEKEENAETGPADAEKKTPQECSTDDERFIIGMYRILSAEDQYKIGRELVDLASKQNEKLLGNHKKV